MLTSFRAALCTSSWTSVAQNARVLAAVLDKALSLPAPTTATQYLSFSTGSESKPYYNVPAGHINSDLSSASCHIGLGRRRDLTLRQDLRLHTTFAAHTLTEVFKGKKVIVLGFPGGKVCTEKHLPGFVQAAPSLKLKGVDSIICVSVGESSELHDSLTSAGTQLGDIIQVVQDKNGGFVRLLGLDLEDPTSGQGPKCQRYAAVVDDGILLKLAVEKSPADLTVTDASSVTKIWENIYC